MKNKTGIDWSKKDIYEAIGRPDLKLKTEKMEYLSRDKIREVFGRLNSTAKIYELLKSDEEYSTYRGEALEIVEDVIREFAISTSEKIIKAIEAILENG